MELSPEVQLSWLCHPPTSSPVPACSLRGGEVGKKRESLDVVLSADSPPNSCPLQPMSPSLLAGQPASP